MKREVEWNTHRKGKETEDSPSTEIKTVGRATQSKVAVTRSRFPIWEILSASLCLAIRLLSMGLGGPVMEVFLVVSTTNQNRQCCLYNKSHHTPFFIQGWSEKGKGSGLTRTPETVLGWHLPTWAGQGGGGVLGWQLLIYFQGRKESQRVRDVKARDETVMDKSLTFAHSYCTF